MAWKTLFICVDSKVQYTYTVTQDRTSSKGCYIFFSIFLFSFLLSTGVTLCDFFLQTHHYEFYKSAAPIPTQSTFNAHQCYIQIHSQTIKRNSSKWKQKSKDHSQQRIDCTENNELQFLSFILFLITKISAYLWLWIHPVWIFNVCRAIRNIIAEI